MMSLTRRSGGPQPARAGLGHCWPGQAPADVEACHAPQLLSPRGLNRGTVSTSRSKSREEAGCCYPWLCRENRRVLWDENKTPFQGIIHSG